MKKLIKNLSIVALIMFLLPDTLFAQRKFIHPGLTYTQGDIDRMKAMIAARQEPFYSTYVAFAASVVTPGTLSPVTQIIETQHNNTIGMDGRRAHDNALMWHLSGNKTYADNAVKYLNRYLNLTNSSSRGTGPLDNGKIYMLIEAAEMVRDYSGWRPEDQAKFKSMLVHPGYSTKVVPSSHFSNTDNNNDVTFYWNIYNFDTGRFGNQGLFAARGMMSMGIYLDNDTIYDRAYRYLLALPHRPDDIPYPSGPAIPGSKISETDYMIDYNKTNDTTIPDYGYDELLKYYIYANGQCQESCRDQGHTMGGIGNYTCIAEMAWNQGDSLYSCLDNRILLGVEYNTRYNLSYLQSYPDQPAPWAVTGFSTKETDCTYDNGIFYQAWSRSGRWFGKNIYPLDRGNVFGPGGWTEQTLAHYKVRAGANAEDIKWLQRSNDKLISTYGYENWGVSGHHYEWYGWGTLTKRRSAWMAGDPVTFASGERVSRTPSAPCTIAAVDYDYYSENGEGHTYHNAGKNKNTLYRTDGTVEIIQDGADYAVTDMVAGEWLNYTVIFPAPEGNTKVSPTQKYNIFATYKSSGAGAKLFVSVDDGEKKGKELAAADEWTERCLGTFAVTCGAAVMRVYVKGIDNILKLKELRIEPIETLELVTIDLNTKAESVKIYNSSNVVEDTPANDAIIALATDGDYNVPINLAHQRFLVYDFGEQGFDISRITLYNNGEIQDTREQVKILGSTKDGPYTSSWSQNTAQDILRTNGNIYGSMPIINNSWGTTGGNIGYYTVGPVGKYRYFSVYNWSTICQISELEIKSIMNTASATEDTEPSATWDNTDFTGQPQITITDKIISDQGRIFCANVRSLDVYSINGIQLYSVKRNEIALQPGLYIVRAVFDDHIAVSKVIVRK